MILGLDYATDFNGMKSMTTYDTVPVTTYADGVPFDLTQASKVTVHVGSQVGYVGSFDLDITTNTTLLSSGVLLIPITDTFMRQLSPDVYYLEIWVDVPSGRMIFPSSGVLPFTVDDNLMTTADDTVSTVTMYQMQQSFDELANIYQNGQATINRISGGIGQAISTVGNDSTTTQNHQFRELVKGITRPALMKDTWNQTYHFGSPIGWSNDIQTIIKVNDHWNIYYLNNADKDKAEMYTEWYLMQTTDFKSFKDAGVALHRMPNLWGEAFSGSIIRNLQDDGNVINQDVPTNSLLAFFCGSNGSGQQIYCAYSDDDGLNFHPLDGSLVLPRPDNTVGFRDSKAIYNTSTKTVVLYVVKGPGNDGTEIHCYSSPTGKEKSWTDLGKADIPSQNWTSTNPSAYECPNILQNVTDKSTGRQYDIMLVSGNAGPDGLGTFYCLGKLDDNGVFRQIPGSNMQRLDYGLDCYAGNFTEMPTAEGSYVNINWIGSWSRPYPDVMRNNNNYHMGGASLARKVVLRNGTLENDIIEPANDTMLHWYDTNGVTLTEDSSKAKIVAKFNDNIVDNTFTFDYGDGVVKVIVRNQHVYVQQPSGILSVPNGADAPLEGNINQLIFYLDKSSLEVYIPQEKKIMTHLMLSNGNSVGFHSDVSIKELIIRQFRPNVDYGGSREYDYAHLSNPSTQINGSTSTGKDGSGNGNYTYHDDWGDSLANLTNADEGYYSLAGNTKDAPDDFGGYGNVYVTHNKSDTFVVLKGINKEQQGNYIWVNHYGFGKWNGWIQIAPTSTGVAGKDVLARKGDWTSDLTNLNKADIGIYAIPGVFKGIPDNFGGYGNVEVTKNDSDTFVVLKGADKDQKGNNIWINQFTFGKWVGWTQLNGNSNNNSNIGAGNSNYMFHGTYSDDLYNANNAADGYYTLAGNNKNTPAGFSGWGMLEIKHMSFSTYITIKALELTWTNAYDGGRWHGWQRRAKASDDDIYEIDDAFKIQEPGTYTHPFGQHMKNIPSRADELNDFTIVALGWQKTNDVSGYVRKWVRKLILIDADGNEYTSIHNLIKDTFSDWRQISNYSDNPETFRRGDLPDNDLNKVITAGIYRSGYGQVINWPDDLTNTYTMIRLEVIVEKDYIIQKLYPLGGAGTNGFKIPMYIRNYIDGKWCSWKAGINI